ncbi:hypothetical protein A606_05380 [Corynebacterium terpenotabidum Y-11]|uniref:Tetratricopeptide repeat protein n=2 Tax=Corynebacterium terpenotabidum TaxID=89154 RepID=S4XJG9_9CORY|nr:hypothetical protein A606_05380 [Corynebacterium terpenotabidum Y-11]
MGGAGMTATELLDKAQSMPYGEEERDLLREALALAQETGDSDAEFRIRLCLTASYRQIEDNASFLTHFSAAVGFHDRDPQRFPGRGDGTYPDLFWQYKHAVHVVTMSVLFSRAQAEAMLDQMDAHFRAAGVPETAVDIERRDDAIVNGHPATALALQAKIDMLGGEDPFDDCVTCRWAGQMDLCLATGDSEGADAALRQILEAGNVGCVMEPETALARYMLLALENGDAEFATWAQQTSAAANPAFQGLNTVGQHLEFLGVTGNYTRGLGMLQRYQRGLLTDPLSTGEHFGLLAGAWVLLAATSRAGFGDVLVSGSGASDLAVFYGDAGETGDTGNTGDTDFTVADLAARCEAAARSLAERYDARNGTDNFAARIAETADHATWDITLDPDSTGPGSTNLLLRAEIATPDPTPPTGSDILDQLNLALATGADATAAQLVATVPDLEGTDLASFYGMRVAVADMAGDLAAVETAYADYVAVLEQQGGAEASFLATVSARELLDPGPDMLDRFRAEAERLRPGSLDPAAVRAWVNITVRMASGLVRQTPDPAAPDAHLTEARQRLREAETLVRDAGLADEFGPLTVTLFGMDLASGSVTDPPATFASLHDALAWPHTVPLDLLFASAATRAGAEDGFAVIDRLLVRLIDLGVREVTANVALDSVDHLAGVHRFTEAAERAHLAVRELAAAGLPTRDATLKHGEMLVYSGSDAEGRDLLEPLLLPKLEQHGNGTAVEFSLGELDALFALGIVLKNTDASPEAAAFTLLKTRDLGMKFGNPSLAVAAVIAFTDMAHLLGEFDTAVAELTATLPAAAEVPDDGWSEIRLRDRIAVTQADADNPAALDTLADTMSRAGNLEQRIYVQESFNRVLYTFGRLEECLAGCTQIAQWILAGSVGDGSDVTGDAAEDTAGDAAGNAADLASAQLFQGAQYAVWGEDLPAAVEMLKKAAEVPGVNAGSRVSYYRNLAQLTRELGRTREAETWDREAEKLAATLDE